MTARTDNSRCSQPGQTARLAQTTQVEASEAEFGDLISKASSFSSFSAPSVGAGVYETNRRTEGFLNDGKLGTESAKSAARDGNEHS